jgi:hypothetical protein
LLFFSSLANKLLVLPFSRTLTINMCSIKHIMHYNRIYINTKIHDINFPGLIDTPQ